MRSSFLVLLVTLLCTPFLSNAAVSQTAVQTGLFKMGSESFALKDQKGREPQFRVLDSTPTKQALAAAIVTALNAQPETEPKLPVKGYVDLNLQKIRFNVDPKNNSELHLFVRLNGHDLELPKTINREELLSGKMIDVDFPSSDRDVAIFNLHSGGHLKFRFDSKKNELAIANATAKLTYDSDFAGDGTETVQFSGRGIHEMHR
jgi:hypothetical protein